MNTNTFDRSSLCLSATLLLVGQLLYVLVTLLHTGGEANHHSAIFAAYADSGIWTGVHVAQFACMAIMLAGLFALFSAVDVQKGMARVAARLGSASTTATLTLYGVVMAVDGVALKQAVSAWAAAPDADKAARFAAAEAMRWLEWGARSYVNFTLALAVLCAAMVVRTARIPRPISYVMGLSAVTYLAPGWVAGTAGFSHTQTIAIVLAETLNVAWMIWLLVIAWGIRESERMTMPPAVAVE